MRVLLMVLAATAALGSACAPTLTPEQQQEAECRASGGKMQRVGRLQTLQCVIQYRDAGKACRSGSDCLGDCVAVGSTAPLEGRATAGVCQADSNRFGCRTRVEDGRATPTICVD